MNVRSTAPRLRFPRASGSRRRFLAAALALAATLPAPIAALAQARTDVHGALDAYAGHGVAMAWGILRGKDEASTLVLVRIDADPARYRSLEVTGNDPFTHKGEALAPLAALDGTVVVRVPRSRFADLPQTAWRFLPKDAATPMLVVDYRGIPDTTPEFDDPAKLEASLAARVTQARNAPGVVK